jgi:hypothetical protein
VSDQGVEETLAWEAQWRPRAATAAALGGLLTFVGLISYVLIANGQPDDSDGAISIVESLRGVATGQPPAEESLVVRQIDFMGDKAVPLTLSTLATVVGILLMLGALTYVFRATRARNPAMIRVVGWSLAAALALYPIGAALKDIPTWIEYASFTDAAERTPAAARDIEREGIPLLGAFLYGLGLFAFAIAVMLVSLNAMRVGLFTRFMGILGMIIGVISAIAYGFAPLLLLVWMTFLGLLIAGRYPGGVPPAWVTGRAEPWPTQQQLRERRDAMRAEHAPAPQPAGAAGDEPDAGYHPGKARRKRKKRR